jgi:hypothetical protein
MGNREVIVRQQPLCFPCTFTKSARAKIIAALISSQTHCHSGGCYRKAIRMLRPITSFSSA